MFGTLFKFKTPAASSWNEFPNNIFVNCLSPTISEYSANPVFSLKATWELFPPITKELFTVEFPNVPSNKEFETLFSTWLKFPSITFEILSPSNKLFWPLTVVLFIPLLKLLLFPFTLLVVFKPISLIFGFSINALQTWFASSQIYP